jgi:hypothetical protein
MRTTSPAIEKLARQLLADGPTGARSSNGEAGQAVRACERLRVPLTKFTGAAGFSSLLSRALTLARRQAPSLERLRVDADGSLAGFSDVQQDAEAAEAARAGEVLVAEFLGLLVTFIGERLTLSLVREAWPDAPLEIMTLNAEDKS